MYRIVVVITLQYVTFFLTRTVGCLGGSTPEAIGYLILYMQWKIRMFLSKIDNIFKRG